LVLTGALEQVVESEVVESEVKVEVEMEMEVEEVEKLKVKVVGLGVVRHGHCYCTAHYARRLAELHGVVGHRVCPAQELGLGHEGLAQTPSDRLRRR
jgi:hypothetical protein